MSDFTDDDLRLIMAMCRTANPGYPQYPMIPAFAEIYDKAAILLRHTQLDRYVMGSCDCDE